MRREGDYYENEFCKKSNSTCNVRFVCCFDGRLRKFCIYRKEVEVTSVEDLADLKIGVQTGTTGDSQASDALMQIPRCSVTTKAPMLFRH